MWLRTVRGELFGGCRIGSRVRRKWAALAGPFRRGASNDWKLAQRWNWTRVGWPKGAGRLLAGVAAGLHERGPHVSYDAVGTLLDRAGEARSSVRG